MSITPKQPGFYSQPNDKVGGIPATDYDNLSDEELLGLINSANALKGGKGRIAKQAAPEPKRVFDLDKFIEDQKNG